MNDAKGKRQENAINKGRSIPSRGLFKSGHNDEQKIHSKQKYIQLNLSKAFLYSTQSYNILTGIINVISMAAVTERCIEYRQSLHDSDI